MPTSGSSQASCDFGLGVVEGSDLVGDVGNLAEHLKAVPEANRDPELAVGLVVEHVPLPLPVGWRAAPQVDGDVEDRAAHAAQQACPGRGGSGSGCPAAFPAGSSGSGSPAATVPRSRARPRSAASRTRAGSRADRRARWARARRGPRAGFRSGSASAELRPVLLLVVGLVLAGADRAPTRPRCRGTTRPSARCPPRSRPRPSSPAPRCARPRGCSGGRGRGGL